MKDLRETIGAAQRLIDHLPVAAYAAQTGAEANALYVSPGLERLLGYPLTEYRANPRLWSDQIHVDDRKRVLAEVADCQAQGKTLDTRYRVSTRDGRVVWVSDRATIIGGGRDADAFRFGVLSEVSEPRADVQKLARIDHRFVEMGIIQPIWLHDGVKNAERAGTRPTAGVNVMMSGVLAGVQTADFWQFEQPLSSASCADRLVIQSQPVSV